MYHFVSTNFEILNVYFETLLFRAPYLENVTSGNVW